jgi:glycosyltransferase involved in cell wall biosynthesis
MSIISIPGGTPVCGMETALLQRSATDASEGSHVAAADPIRVVMVDAMSIVPYYTGHLCERLREAPGVCMTLASTTYQHDPEFFARRGLEHNRGMLDVSHHLRKFPALLRRGVKMSEYLLNLGCLLARFTIRRPDVVHIQFLPLLSHGLPVETLWLRGLRLLGVKIVYTVHNVLPQDGASSIRGYRTVYRLADRLVCHDSASARRMTAEFEVPENRVSLIPHGPLFENERDADGALARKRLGFAPDDCVALWQGILRPYKGVVFLLEAWKLVCEQDPRARLAIVGSGDSAMRQQIRDEVRRLGLEDRVRLDLRFVSVQEMAEYYEAADVAVYPYREITTSGALLTGIVRGKAIVATRLPAFEQILRHEDNALLVRYGDAGDLAATLLRVVRDPALRRALGRRLLESQADIPRWSQIAGRTAQCYRAVLSAAGGYAEQAAAI